VHPPVPGWERPGGPPLAEPDARQAGLSTSDRAQTTSDRAQSPETAYLAAMQKADVGEYGPLGELLARAMYDNLNRFIVPNLAGPARIVPLASMVNNDLQHCCPPAGRTTPTIGCGPRIRRHLANLPEGRRGLSAK